MAILSSLLFLNCFALKYSPQSPQTTPFLLGEGVASLTGGGGGGSGVGKGRQNGGKQKILQKN